MSTNGQTFSNPIAYFLPLTLALLLLGALLGVNYARADEVTEEQARQAVQEAEMHYNQTSTVLTTLTAEYEQLEDEIAATQNQLDTAPNIDETERNNVQAMIDGADQSRSGAQVQLVGSLADLSGNDLFQAQIDLANGLWESAKGNADAARPDFSLADEHNFQGKTLLDFGWDEIWDARSAIDIYSMH